MVPVRFSASPGAVPQATLPFAGTFRKRAIIALSMLAFAFHVYTAMFGLFSATLQRSFHWWLFGSLLFFLPSTTGMRGKPSFALDVLCILGLSAGSLYLALNWEDMAFRLTTPAMLELLCGGALILVTLEAARRTLGLFLPLTATVFLAYAITGPYLPGLLKHKGYSLSRIISYLYATSSGIYGIPLGVSATYITLFVFFGAFLNISGAAKVLMECSLALTGRFVGGAAKTAIVASALMGTMSGSSIANAVTTGTITIPLMRQSGFDKNTACAIEAVASTGGMIMPPVMGAAAFLMAEYLHASYLTVMKAAFLPALVYFASIYFTVDFYARKHGIGGSASRAGEAARAVRQGWHLALPIVALIWLLMRRYSPMTSVVWSLLFLVGISWLRQGTRLTPARCTEAILAGAKNTVTVAAACACSGIILGVMALTGAGATLSVAIFSQYTTFLPGALLAAMGISLVLGMGMPPTAVYLILAAVAAPPLVRLGVSPLAAHMFVFYFGIISTITPPVALTSYAAAAVGGGDGVRTGLLAFIFGIAAYCIPFVLVYAPELLLVTTIPAALLRFALSIAAVFAVALAIVGFIRVQLTVICRCLAGAAGALLITPNFMTDLAGLALLAVVLLMHQARKTPALST